MTAPAATSTYIRQRARAELLSNLGAGVLGAGVALLFRETVGTAGVPLLGVGGVVHAAAMYQKHHLDASAGAELPRWSTWLYWTCWLLLLALAGYVWLSQG